MQRQTHNLLTGAAMAQALRGMSNTPKGGVFLSIMPREKKRRTIFGIIRCFTLATVKRDGEDILRLNPYLTPAKEHGHERENLRRVRQMKHQAAKVQKTFRGMDTAVPGGDMTYVQWYTGTLNG